MNFSRIFILRPIATSLLMLALVLVGWMSYRSLPVSALPDVDYPTLQITTNYPGASAQLVASTITAPLEKQFAMMPGLTHMESTSSHGVSVITLSFALSLPLDIAEQQVQAGINNASNLLPTELPLPPIYHKMNPADTPMLTLAISSDAMTQRDLQRLIETRLVMQLSQITGVGLISLAGDQRPAIRIAVNPAALTAHQLSLEQVRQAIIQENVHLSKGSFQGELRASTIDANDQLMSPQAYRQLIIAYQQGSPVRLGDIASISDSAEDIYRRAWYQDQRAILLNIYRQPNSNMLNTAEGVKQQLANIQEQLPESVQIQVASDRTHSVRSMIQATQTDLWLAIALVVAIIWLFLRQVSLTLIPALTIPLSLLTSLTLLSLSGFSINLLSLLALIIATGFVVDDSIVMLENISRHRAMGKSSVMAAIDGAQEITLTIIALTLALLAVLIPLLFMGEVIGRLFYEFALTLAVALISSAVISLTLTPMLAARLSQHHEVALHQERLAGIRNYYLKGLAITLKHPWKMMWLNVAMIGFSLWLLYDLPKSFFPEQDTEQLMAEMTATQNASFEQVQQKLTEVSERLQQEAEVVSVTSFVGIDAQNPSPITGRLSIELTPRQMRHQSAKTLAQAFEQLIPSSVTGIEFHATATQAITLETHLSASPYQIRLSEPNAERLAASTLRLTEAMTQSSHFINPRHSMQAEGLSLRLTLDRDMASRMGISTKEINNALYNAFGQRIISLLYSQSSQQKVILTLDSRELSPMEQLRSLHIRNAAGNLIPLSLLIRVEEVFSPIRLEKYHQFPATHIAFSLAEGVGLNQALTELQHRQTMAMIPEGTKVEPIGILAVFAQSQSQQIGLLVGAVIAVYILLGMLYESFIHPITILSTLLPAVLGGLMSLLVLHHPLDMMAMIGMILLVGIVMKNAIMMIDFALSALKNQALSPSEAMLQACELRFRPILMTSLSALLAAVPLLLSDSMGSELRHGMGAVIIGGLLLSQLITLFTTPAIFVLLQSQKQAAVMPS